jgi:hypothetical protein
MIHDLHIHFAGFNRASLLQHERQPDVAYGSLGDVCSATNYVRFSNRPVGVKHFQAIHRCSVDVARGLVLLSGIGTGPFHHGIRGRGGTIFTAALPSDGRFKRTCELTSSIVPRGTSFHRRVEFEFPPIGSDLSRCHAAAVACSRVQRNSVPSTQMRCMITANRRASATIAFFIPRRLAICIAQALSQDHFFERIML